jgi:tetratricopeptide (TPR) repeat protein
MRQAVTYIFLFIFFWCIADAAHTQPGTTVDLKKPEHYENRTLASEKTGQKKFNFSHRFFQNTYTHYNYYFNAKNRLNDIIDEAKRSSQDDYTKLLTFYNYSLDVTSASGDLDSIIYKCNAGILLHDLRNDWVDNLYLILGEAYFYRKNFDSAEQVFRYINYAFAPKEEGGFDIPIGSNASKTNGVFSIATKENDRFPKKLVSEPPSRNDALLWQARNYTETDRLGEASGILEVLRNDPVFPARLQSQLQEIMAYWYYKQQVYDSAAAHLSKALNITENKLEKARREFLVGQLYQLANNSEQAIAWYNKCAEITTDPIMEVYANLNSIIASGGKEEKILQEKLNNLLKMAHRDKYMGNRDIIYYAIAEVELEKNDIVAGQKMLKKSIQYNLEDNPVQRSRSFLLLADINYDQQQYIASKNFYDSVNISSITNDSDKLRINARLPALNIIAGNLTVIHNQDSLQKVAALPKDQRDAVVRKMVKTLRKQQGLNEEPEININPAVQQAPVNIFNTGNTSSDWYFNNVSLKSTGFNQFRAKWGNRPNTDNWRRLAAINAQSNNNQENIDSSDALENPNAINDSENNGTGTALEDSEITFDAVYANLPLTEEQLKASNNKIAGALFHNGVAFQNKLEDYPSAINAYEELLRKYPDSTHKEEALFNLYYCYNRIGRKFSADSVRNALKRNFSKGSWTAKLNIPQTNATGANTNDPATLKYKEIYNLFIEGKFEEAKNEKAKADSMYGNSYWTPQLLYIESIYYVSKREDSSAIERLHNLETLYPQSPLAEKATTMIDVLRRRNQIENYLTKLQIKRYEEDETAVVDLTPVKPTIQKVEVKRDSVVSNPVTQLAKTKLDTSSGAPPVVKTFEFNAKDSQFVAILLDKVAAVYVNEAKNAFNRYNQITFYNQKFNLMPVKLDDRYNLVLIGPFADADEAVKYVDKTKPATTARILPWLTPDKYSYAIISKSNLDVLLYTKDVDSYKKLLEKVLPGKF